MKGLEALEKVKRTIKAELAELDLMGFEQGDKYNYLEQLLNELTDVEKSLKALEIIKEKNVNVGWFKALLETKGDSYVCYLYWVNYTAQPLLAEEEFNLLKEILE